MRGKKGIPARAAPPGGGKGQDIRESQSGGGSLAWSSPANAPWRRSAAMAPSIDFRCRSEIGGVVAINPRWPQTRREREASVAELQERCSCLRTALKMSHEVDQILLVDFIVMIARCRQIGLRSSNGRAMLFPTPAPTGRNGPSNGECGRPDGPRETVILLLLQLRPTFAREPWYCGRF